MTFRSILFANQTALAERVPDSFKDLNLDQVVDQITAGRAVYDLAPYFWTPLPTVAEVTYRHEIFRDLDGKVVLDDIRSFAKRLRETRDQLILATKLYSRLQRERWFLAAAETYCGAVQELSAALAEARPKSAGLRAFREYLIDYDASESFRVLSEQTAGLAADLATVRYNLLIGGSKITVSRYDDEADYSVQIEQTFDRFKQGAVKDYRIGFSSPRELNHVEDGILERVAKLYPEIFTALDEFCDHHQKFLDETIAVFDREVQFYVSYLEYLEPLRSADLEFAYPTVTASKSVHATQTFDLALAAKLVKAGTPIVCNDFQLSGQERIFVVTGPNQGGKTTFARTFGQLHWLANLGCPVPGTDAALHLFDHLLTHFEKEEDLGDLRGKLQDDLVRIHNILEQASGDSVVIMNEIFTSTTLQDAIVLSRRVMDKIIDLDLLCVCVTFIDELATQSDTTVSMVSTVDPADLASRTFKVVRRPADGLAYAAAIADKYRLSYQQLKGRLNR